MLLKFVAVFGSTIKATISAPPSVGVDLHREQRCVSFSPDFPLSVLFSFHVDESKLYDILMTGGNAAMSALWNCKKFKQLFQRSYGNNLVVFGVAE